MLKILRVRFFQVRPNSSNFEKNGVFAPRKDFRVQGGLRFSQTIRQTLRLRLLATRRMHSTSLPLQN